MRTTITNNFCALVGILSLSISVIAQTSTIDPDQYAFQYSNDPEIGLFFNAVDGNFEIKDVSGTSVFGINANVCALTTNLSLEQGNDLYIKNDNYALRGE